MGKDKKGNGVIMTLQLSKDDAIKLKEAFERGEFAHLNVSDVNIKSLDEVDLNSKIPSLDNDQ